MPISRAFSRPGCPAVRHALPGTQPMVVGRMWRHTTRAIHDHGLASGFLPAIYPATMSACPGSLMYEVSARWRADRREQLAELEAALDAGPHSC